MGRQERQFRVVHEKLEYDVTRSFFELVLKELMDVDCFRMGGGSEFQCFGRIYFKDWWFLLLMARLL